MSDNRETVIEEYGQDCQIVHEVRDYPDQYHFEDSNGRMRTFESIHEARLYADLYTVTGGFNEKQTGNRGVPPAIARASDEIRMTYLAVQMSITYAARAFAVDESTVCDTINRIHARAEKQRP
ncbi:MULTISPECIES: hypothetical protein [Haloarcula]|uniref:hypothetical protein n=1 Tax=Haloarcula TaxID=2237 RepID=UPI0023ECF82E|nr:hypothetical protein [Halomicroarcula sp. XH51]